MKDFLQKMSRRQHVWLITYICLMAALFSVGVIQEIHLRPRRPSVFSREMAIKQIASKLGVTEKALARELELPLNANKYQSLKNLGVDQSKFNQVVRHLLGHRNSMLKYYLFVIFVLRISFMDGGAYKPLSCHYRYPGMHPMRCLREGVSIAGNGRASEREIFPGRLFQLCPLSERLSRRCDSIYINN
jgi:hypothetical protein